MLNDNGERVEDHENMCGIVKQYFAGVIAGDIGETNTAQSNSPRSISRDQNEKLIEEVSFEEFTIAIKQMHPDKASGPDGLM